VRQRDRRGGRRRGAGGHARHHAPGDAGGGEGGRLLAAAAEQEGIAALQPHHALPGARRGDQPRGDLRMRHRRRALALADRHERGARPHQAQHAATGQRVVQDDVGAAQRLGGAQRQQARVAGAGADEPDLAGAGAGVLRGGDSGAPYSTINISIFRYLRFPDSSFGVSHRASGFSEMRAMATQPAKPSGVETPRQKAAACGGRSPPNSPRRTAAAGFPRRATTC
jgi:hypothetical protein